MLIVSYRHCCISRNSAKAAEESLLEANIATFGSLQEMEASDRIAFNKERAKAMKEGIWSQTCIRCGGNHSSKDCIHSVITDKKKYVPQEYSNESLVETVEVDAHIYAPARPKDEVDYMDNDCFRWYGTASNTRSFLTWSKCL